MRDQDQPTVAGPTQPGWIAIPAHRPLAPNDPREIGGYRLRARLGEGGMGQVYLSYTPGGRPVAVKIVRPEYAGDPAFRRRFEQEIVTAQRVQGLYTAPLIDANPHAPQPWLATAYVPGPSLQHAVGAYGALPPESVLVLVAGVAEALQSIHAAGVVHRDLKPSNVILAADGPRVIDFGIARAVDTTSVTQTAVRVGTPAFMAPEQVRGRDVTPAIDIFALGTLACFAATGELPFGGGLDPAVPYRILEQEPDLSACPPQLHHLVTSCLAKDPLQRPEPAQVIELCRTASTGTRLQRGEGWLPPSVAAAVNLIAAAPLPAEPRQPKPHRQRAVLLAVTGAVLAVAAVAAVVTVAVLGSRANPQLAAGGSSLTSTATSPQTSTSADNTRTINSTETTTRSPGAVVTFESGGSRSGSRTTASTTTTSAAVLAHNRLRLAANTGVDVGTIPLEVTDATLSFWTADADVVSGGGSPGIISEWTGTQAPTAQDCAEQIRTQPINKIHNHAGLQFCTRGRNTQRIAYVQVISFDGQVTQADVTVWDQKLNE